MALTVIFASITIALTIKVWPFPTKSVDRPAGAYWIAVSFIAISSVLQIPFLVCVESQVIPLSSSLAFALIGGPLCLSATLTAKFEKKKWTGSDNAVVGGLAGMVLWFIFVTLH